jgi:hypothetical protein
MTARVSGLFQIAVKSFFQHPKTSAIYAFPNYLRSPALVKGSDQLNLFSDETVYSASDCPYAPIHDHGTCPANYVLRPEFDALSTVFTVIKQQTEPVVFYNYMLLQGARP